MDILANKSTEYRATYGQVMLVLRMKDKDTIINPITRELLAMSLTDFIYESLDKYIKGQIEHGGSIKDRNLDQEIRNEVIDIWWYTAAKSWPSHLK